MPTFPVDLSAGAHFTFGRPRPARIPAASRETVRVMVTARLNGATVDPDAGEVSFAFMAPGAAPEEAPEEEDFVLANWELNGRHWEASCLVGPGGVAVLSPALYRVWVKVSDDPEIPVRDVGDMAVY